MGPGAQLPAINPDRLTVVGKPPKGSRMTMMNTLAKVAVAVAQIKAPIRGATGDPQGAAGLFAALNSNDPTDGSVMDKLLSGSFPDRGGLGQLLEALSSDTPSGTKARSDMDNLIAGLGGADAADETALAGFGTVLCSQFEASVGAPLTPSPDQEATASLLIKALLQALRHDPGFDSVQQDTLLARLSGVSDAGREFVLNVLQEPAGAVELVRQVPPWLEPQVYMISVLGADPAQGAEAAYLRALSGQMAVGRDSIDRIHDQLGVVRLDRAA